MGVEERGMNYVVNPAQAAVSCLELGDGDGGVVFLLSPFPTDLLSPATLPDSQSLEAGRRGAAPS